MSKTTLRKRAIKNPTGAFSRRSDAVDSDFEFDPGNIYSGIASTTEGKKLTKFLLSDGCVYALIGAVFAAPSRAPVAVLTPFMEHHVGVEAFEPFFKQFTGRCIRQLLEHLGAKFRRSNVPIAAVGSAYGSGAVFTFKSVALTENVE